ncbi:3D domain-containing protein [Bdellovibrio svalbardensis]|uniref:3D domain-containing protein n=1 Tax=Bdellovibrio svalbardensis TaxID=2972972 RepID=A0ABT6DJA4_9BACT|nr:3D domain-containing protein [Bdellovibrio svalbardensis]MDG0816915.1 3D domain-containing protein [Bdellovibrio svalbardensis]
MKQHICLTNVFQKSCKFVSQPLVLCALIATAQAGSSRNVCSSDVAVSSIYFIPHIKDYCRTSTPCEKFKRQVRLQGSGTLSGNRLLTYTGKTRSMGSCDTSFGASGNCLIPFISVAADPRFYSMGDIIQMPSMKGKVLTLPNGKTMVHPGFLIVHDTGGAIRGKNRFDFFTGSYSMRDPGNPFGSKGRKDLQMLDRTSCTDNKKFTVVRRGSYYYQNSLLAIEDSLRDVYSDRKVMVASNSRGAR